LGDDELDKSICAGRKLYNSVRKAFLIFAGGNADHLPFEALGYTVIGFHDDGVTKNPNYHKSTDTPDTLEYQYLTSN
jgi:hypothetical protein